MTHPGLCYKKRRRPTLPHSLPCSTIGAEKLNFRVRNGNGWVLLAMTAVKQKTEDRSQFSMAFGLINCGFMFCVYIKR